MSVDFSGETSGSMRAFPDTQEFFATFLEACDSFALNTRIRTMLAACLAQLSLPQSPAGVRFRLDSIRLHSIRWMAMRQCLWQVCVVVACAVC